MTILARFFVRVLHAASVEIGVVYQVHGMRV